MTLEERYQKWWPTSDGSPEAAYLAGAAVGQEIERGRYKAVVEAAEEILSHADDTSEKLPCCVMVEEPLRTALAAMKAEEPR